MEYYRIKKEDLYQEIKSREPLSVATHRDADGIYSLALLDTVFKVTAVNIPDEFGDYGFPSTDPDVPQEDVSCDLGEPRFPDWEGIAIDHHPHENVESMKYKLVKGVVPTGLMVWELFKDRIPKDQWWKAAGACVGDGQPELIPAEIFEACPMLLERRGNLYKSQYNKLSHYVYDIYKLLSSPINAVCRTGRALEAFKILRICRTPDQVLSHPIFKESQDLLNKEIDSIFNQFGRDKRVRKNTIILGNRFIVIPFESDYFIASRIASEVANVEKNYTIIAINERKKEISIRGDHASTVRDLMVGKGWSIGGHMGYMGGILNRSAQEFINDLRSAIYSR